MVGHGCGFAGRLTKAMGPGDEVAPGRETAAPINEQLTPAPTPQQKPLPLAREKEFIPNEENKELEEALKELLRIGETCKPLVALLEEFSPGEDTVRHNYKLKKFEEAILNLCPSDEQIQQAFASFMAAALLNAATAQKLVLVGSSPTWGKGSKMHAPLLNSMQDTFAKLDVLKRAHPKFLINAADFMGDYFAGARLENSDKVRFLAKPLHQYFGALLTSDDPGAHRCLATQLMQNGKELVTIIPEQIGELSVSIRARMLQLNASKCIWLMLAADLSLLEFRALPRTLEVFYANKIVNEAEKT